MDVVAPYLAAIQAIPGNMPGEKYKAIKLIAIKASESIKAGGDIPEIVATQNVPRILEPLVRVEVAKILKQHEVIVEGLKSKDMMIIRRSLQARWFFEGTNGSVVNADYFEKHVFPEISLYARSRVIKSLADNLKDPATAAEFFLKISKTYGTAAPAVNLLAACDEKFILPMIIDKRIILSNRMILQIYRKYPDVVIQYLKLSKDDDTGTRNIHKIDIYQYQGFLAMMAKKHCEAFMDIFEMHDGLPSVSLSMKTTQIFLKRYTQEFLDKPSRYLRMLQMKSITTTLTKDQFAEMFRKLLPEDESKFSFDELFDYLDFYQKNDKLALMLDSYREVYGKNLLDCKLAVSLKLMKILPPEERVRQARIKLEEDKDWHLNNTESSWRCYLPIDESIPVIKNEISKTPGVDDRGDLLLQLVYTCKVNDDKDALLEVMKYFMDRHRNEQMFVRFDFIEYLERTFDLVELSGEHWAILHNFIEKAYVQNEFFNNAYSLNNVLEKAVLYDFINDLPIDKDIKLILEMQMKSFSPSWNYLKKYPEYERKCLDIFLTLVPKEYPDDDKIWKDQTLYILRGLMTSMYDYNKRNENAGNNMKKISIKDYPWLYEKVKATVCSEAPQSYNRNVWGDICELLKENEKDLYRMWIRDGKAIPDLGLDDILEILQKDPQRILKDWKQYLQNIGQNLHWQDARQFITKSRWYQDLPMKIMGQCLADIKQKITSTSYHFRVLALLLDGRTFSQIIKPYEPTGYEIEVKSEESRDNYYAIRSITEGLKDVNPPLPLEVVSTFCVGDYLQLALRSLTSICRRVPVPNVINFAKCLVDKRVSVKKHGIRLVCMVASLEEDYEFLSDLWKAEEHRSIRAVIFQLAYNLFVTQPDPRTWQLLKECIAGLTVDDDKDVFYSLFKLNLIPNVYIADHIELTLAKIELLMEKGTDTELYISFFGLLVGNIDASIGVLLPEEFCEELLKKYLFNFDLNQELGRVGQSFAIRAYILPAKDQQLRSRLESFAELFRTSVEKYWDVPHPKYCQFYPINYIVHSFINSMTSEVIRRKFNEPILDTLLEIFVSAISPEKDAASYLSLVYCVELQRAESPKDFGLRVGQKVSNLIKILTPESVIFMADQLEDTLIDNIFEDVDGTEMRLSVMESLIEVGSIHTCIIAARLLIGIKSKNLVERYRAVVQALREKKHPGISTILYNHINTFPL